MRVLGIDPGLTRCGTAIVDGGPGIPLAAVHIGVIRTESDAALEQRLMAVEAGIAALVDEFAPDAIAIERVFIRRGPALPCAVSERGERGV